MATDTNRFQAIIAHCKEYGFIFPSSEIYDGLAAVYDYGQWGSELKKNNKDSNKRYRVDHLLEAKADELEKAGHPEQAEVLLKEMDTLLAVNDFDGLKTLIENNKIVCPVSGTSNWTEVRQFNLMFSTQIGSVSEEANEIYLRPETAQGIFVNFLNVQKTGRMKIPFGIAQIGKAFRN